MNVITKDELKLIDSYKNSFINSFQEYVTNAINHNIEVQKYLDEHEGKKIEVERTTYFEDRREAKKTMTSKGMQEVLSKKPKQLSAMAKAMEKKYNDRREESKGEFVATDLPTWISANFSSIHANEPHVNQMDPRDKTLTNEDFEANHGSMLKKVALYAAAREINSKRSIWSRIFNWKRNLQNHFATRKIRKSLQEENGLTKKEFYKVYDFVSSKNPNKYQGLVALNEKGEKLKSLEIEGVEENKSQFKEQLFDIKIDEQTLEDKLIKKAELEKEELSIEIEDDEPSLY